MLFGNLALFGVTVDDVGHCNQIATLRLSLVDDAKFLSDGCVKFYGLGSLNSHTMPVSRVAYIIRTYELISGEGAINYHKFIQLNKQQQTQ